MAGKKITELTELTLPTLDDVVPVVNTTTGATMKIKLRYLLGVSQDEADVADTDLVVL